MKFPRSSVTHNSYSFDTQQMFNKETINNTEMYTLTAYFIDPGCPSSLFIVSIFNASILARICTVGRTLSQLEHEGTGTGLFFQNGRNPIQDFIEVPLWEDNIGKTKWVKGTCFKTMGEFLFFLSSFVTILLAFRYALLVRQSFGYELLGIFTNIYHVQ